MFRLFRYTERADSERTCPSVRWITVGGRFFSKLSPREKSARATLIIAKRTTLERLYRSRNGTDRARPARRAESVPIISLVCFAATPERTGTPRRLTFVPFVSSLIGSFAWNTPTRDEEADE